MIGGFDTEIRIYSTIDGSLLKILPSSKHGESSLVMNDLYISGTVTLLKMTSDDKYLISVSNKRYIKVYNLETGEYNMFRHTHSCNT